MAYSKQTWVGGSGGGTPLSADRLNHMETGIDDAHVDLASLPETYAQVVPATTLTGAGIEAAAALAGTNGAVYLLPGETYELTDPITLTGVGLIGDGSPTLNVATSLGTGVAAVTVTAPTEGYNNIPVRGFSLVGPGARSLGVKTADCDGFEITGYAKPIFEDVQVKQFDSGIVLNNTVGHVYFVRVSASDNYYGVYLALNNNDYVFDQCLINGNTFANFACPADQGYGALVVENSHIGYAPYGVYQESTPAAQGTNKVFLQTASFHNARFEQIGNAAIWTDATQDASNFSTSGSILIDNPGFSWGADATYKISALPKTHAVQFSQTDRIIQIVNGAYPFTSGDGSSAPIRVKQSGHAAFEIRGSTAVVSDVQVDAGNTNVYAYAAPIAGVITTNGDSANTQLNVGTTSGYVQPAGSTARRYGADASYLYADFSEWRFRNSASGYALIGRMRSGDLIMPKYALGTAGATGGPTWSKGTGVPAAAEPDGSLYSRTDGGSGSTLYVRVAGAWTAIA